MTLPHPGLSPHPKDGPEARPGRTWPCPPSQMQVPLAPTCPEYTGLGLRISAEGEMEAPTCAWCSWVYHQTHLSKRNQGWGGTSLEASWLSHPTDLKGL